MLTSRTLTIVTFYDYVRQAAGGDSNERIAARVGVTGGTVGRWKFRDPNPRDVAAFAREYGRPMMEAFLAAEWFSPEEAEAVLTSSPGGLSDAELVSEIARRLQAASLGSDPSDVSTSDRLKRRQAEELRNRQRDRERAEKD